MLVKMMVVVVTEVMGWWTHSGGDVDGGRTRDGDRIIVGILMAGSSVLVKIVMGVMAAFVRRMAVAVCW